MDKILQAMEQMIKKSSHITDVVKSSGQVIGSNIEYYFIYKNSYKFSISSRESGDYYLYYYPTDHSLQDLMDMDWDVFNDFVTYKSKSYVTVEQRHLFKKLFEIVRYSLYNIDDVLDDIIGT